MVVMQRSHPYSSPPKKRGNRGIKTPAFPHKQKKQWKPQKPQILGVTTHEKHSRLLPKKWATKRGIGMSWGEEPSYFFPSFFFFCKIYGESQIASPVLGSPAVNYRLIAKYISSASSDYSLCLCRGKSFPHIFPPCRKEICALTLFSRITFSFLFFSLFSRMRNKSRK